MSALDPAAMLPQLMRLGTVLNRSRLVERAVEHVGVQIDRPGLTVLVTLRMAGQPLRVGEIAARMQVVGPHVTRHLHELERASLVRRVVDPDDQRARLVELTDQGSGVAGRYLEAIFGWFGDAIADWSEEDRATFGRLLSRFVDDLQEHLVGE
ncbi:MarR family winged helix-turn-helix transcriptional regulator [Lentzea albida]|uniref:DNA-binding transcriptional regulator, MarR family n=1 Tax=Lentzea albida TaxID=65499 RepID=A0A1H9KN58_9PSEU|nr:MarR family transcriptional regulator [Lentzea albida]SER00283.1 DNA-binding transcriptional regulator, MarR family [Lentzea albida]